MPKITRNGGASFEPVPPQEFDEGKFFVEQKQEKDSEPTKPVVPAKKTASRNHR